MNEFYAESFLQNCGKGNVEECKKTLTQGVDINYADKDGNTGLFHSVINNQIEVIRFLVANQASLELQNKDQTTPLHIACDKVNKEIILFFLTNGFDFTQKNGLGQKYSFLNIARAGEGTMEIKMFINNLASESKAFDVLKQPQKMKLQQIFEDIDTDNLKSIDLQKAIIFNKFIEDGINDNAAEKDGKEFIKQSALCNHGTVNIDEWFFSFSKLYAVDTVAYEKFIDDYDKAVERKGKLRLQGI